MPQPVEEAEAPLLDASKVDGQAIQNLQTKIMHVLAIYQRLSHSMLQVGIGPHVSPTIWRPVLDDLIKGGYVAYWREDHKSPAGRPWSYHVLSLTDRGRAYVGKTAITPHAIPDDIQLSRATG